MQYRKFGKLDIKASALGFGTMRLPTINSDASMIDEEEATKMLQYAIDNGLNYVDTAWPYHREQSELFVGKALKGGYRQKIYLATKMPPWVVNEHADFEKIFIKQLEKLQTDYVDFYLLHSLDREPWHKMANLDYFSWAEKKVQEGKIRFLGFSFHDHISIFKEIVDYYPKWDFAQIQLNYLDTEHQAGLEGLHYASEKGLGVVIMEPLRGGELANPPEKVKDIFNSTGIKRSYVDWALRWLWNLPEVSTVLSGMNTFGQVQENIELASKAETNTLSKEELEIYKKAREVFLNSRPISCTGCSYCLPCAVNISIPDVFDTYNRGVSSNDIERAKKAYNSFFDIKADACIECGTCELQCPQSLPIRELLKKVHEELSNV